MEKKVAETAQKNHTSPTLDQAVSLKTIKFNAATKNLADKTKKLKV